MDQFQYVKPKTLMDNEIEHPSTSKSTSAEPSQVSTSTTSGILGPFKILETEAARKLEGSDTLKAQAMDLSIKNKTIGSCNGKTSKRRKLEKNMMESEINSLNFVAESEIIVNASSKDVPPEDRVFSIHFLMLKIFSHLDPRHLKICRQVSRRWDFYSVHFLHQRQSLRFVSLYKEQITNRGFNVRITQENQVKTECALDVLADLMCQSTTPFPSTFFCFKNGNLNNSSLQNFLTKHGALIKKLRLDIYGLQRGKVPDLNILFKLLFEQVPNVQELRLDDFPDSWLLLMPANSGTGSTGSGSGKQIELKLRSLMHNKSVLPKLKCIEFEDEIPYVIFDFITKSAINLEQIFLRSNKNLHFYFGNVDPKIQTNSINKLHLLKHLNFSPSVDSLDIYSQLVKPDPNTAVIKLKKIDFSFDQVEYRPDLWPAVGQLLCDILRCYSETVEKIRWQPIRFLPADSLRSSNFPILSKVKVLKIEKNHSLYRYGLRRDRGVFPKNLCLSQTFPNLHTIKFYISNVGRSKYHRDLRDPMTNYFNNDNFNSSQPLLTVKKFCINDCDSYPTQLWEEFPKIFCNVQTVIFGGIREFSKVSKALWSFSKLGEIELYFDMGFFEEEEECYLFVEDTPSNGNDDGSVSNNCSHSCSTRCSISSEKHGCLNSFNLDAGFTGFSLETCNKLKHNLFQESEFEHPCSSSCSGFSAGTDTSWVCKSNLEKLRINPSIVDLKDLRRLKIELIDDTEIERDDDEPYFLSVSAVTGLYAFQRCPKLEVSVQVEAEDVKNIYKLKELVNPLRPYVHLGPW